MRPTDITSGDYQGEMNSEKFIGLLRGKLIPNLPPNSVVVIGNASYHSVQEDKCPTQSCRKADMQASHRTTDCFDDRLLLRRQIRVNFPEKG